MSYSQWHSSQHDDEPLDQERELNVPGRGYWASIGPDARQKTGGWSWTILEFDGTDNHDVASAFADDEQAAKQAADDWEAAALSSQPAKLESPVTIFLTYWLPAQYGIGLDAAQVAARLREAGWPDAAATAERIARREITSGDATDDGAVSVNDKAGEALRDLAYAIRKNEELLLPESGGGEPIDFGDPETYHVWLGRARSELATHQIAEHIAQHGHRCPWSGTPATCHLDGTVVWQCPAGCYTSIEPSPAGKPAPGQHARPAPGAGTVVRASAEREGRSDTTLAGLIATSIETGTARVLPTVGRDVCAAVRRAADGESVTGLSIDGRPAAAIVPVDDQGNPACMRAGHMQALAQPGQLPPILRGTEAATYRFTAPAGVTCGICGDAVAAGAADLAVAWAAALEHEYKHRPGV